MPMTDVSTSTFSWLDSSEHERRAVLELVSALNEPGTLDELGIGSIRDTIADTLFPGTSTIQTRARYFLMGSDQSPEVLWQTGPGPCWPVSSLTSRGLWTAK